MDTAESRVHTTLKNSFWSIAGYGAPIIVAIFVTPIIVFGLGDADYGIYTFMLSVVSMLGLIDLGVSTAVIRSITEYHGRGESARLHTLIKSVNTVALLIGVVGFLLCLGLGVGGDALLTGSVAPHALLYYLLTGLIFLVNSASMVYTVIPTALQRFDINAGVGTALLFITSLMSVASVKMGYGIGGLLAIQLVLSIGLTIAYRIHSHKMLPGIATFALGWSMVEVKSFYSFGIKAFCANTGVFAQTYLARLIIPLYLGPAALTYFSVPGNVANKIPGVTNNVSSVLFPLTAHLTSRGETDMVKTAYIRSFRLITVLSAAAATALIIFSKPILLYWLSSTFEAKSASVLIALTLTNFMLALYGPLSNFIVGLGKLRVLTTVSFVMAGVNVVALFILLPRMGIVGAAWAYFISTLPIVYLFYHTERKYLGIESRTHYYLKLILKNAVAIAATWLLCHFALLPLTTSFTTLLFTGTAAVLAYLGIYRLFGFFDEEDSRDISMFIQRFIFRRHRA